MDDQPVPLRTRWTTQHDGTALPLLNRLARLPWFVVVWLALASYVALHSIAALRVAGGGAALTELRPRVSSVAGWLEFPLPGLLLLLAARILMRGRR